MSTSTESAPTSAATDITAAMRRVQDAIGPGDMIPSEEVPDTVPLGPPAVVLQPGDLLAPSPTTRREIAAMIADVARRSLALGGDLEALAREIGANAAQILTTGDRVERLVADVRGIGGSDYVSVQLLRADRAAVHIQANTDEDVAVLVLELGCNPVKRYANPTHTQEWLHADRNDWDGPVGVTVTGPMRPIAAAEQPATTERAA